jgi:hypothetical protein
MTRYGTDVEPEQARWPRLASSPHPELRWLLPRGCGGDEREAPWVALVGMIQAGRRRRLRAHNLRRVGRSTITARVLYRVSPEAPREERSIIDGLCDLGGRVGQTVW